jgi:hypothetical protein
MTARKHPVEWTLAAGAAAAAAYGGYAALAYLRYGHAHSHLVRTALDRFMPEPEVAEHHSITVHAPATIAYDACRKLDVMRSPLVRLIFAARARLMCVDTEQQDLPAPLIDQVQRLGWRILSESRGDEIVVGAACKPWLGEPLFTGLRPDDFARFDEPGWAKIAWNFLVEPMDDASSIVHTETRVVTTDEESRRSFRRYWSLASAGIVSIRRLSLRVVKQDAEDRAGALRFETVSS